MLQLTGTDQQIFAREDARHYGHVGVLAVLDPSTSERGALSVVDIQKLIEERLPLVPPFRWRLVEVPFGLDYGYWIDDPDFDLEFHVRELALAPPGSDEQLADQVERIYSRPLDRSRPLWELYVIHGLPQGRVAVMTKIHCALIDGVSGAEMMGALLDVTPGGREPPPRLSEPSTDAPPGELELLARGLLDLPRYPLRLLGSIRRAMPDIEDVPGLGAIPGVKTAGRMIAGAERRLGRSRVVGSDDLVPPHTSFSGPVSPHRRFTFTQLSLDQVKEVKNRHRVTVNDVIVSICAGAVRRWLTDHRELPEEPLVAQIPVSVRGENQYSSYGNPILLMTAPLYTNVDDSAARLEQTHEAFAQMKELRKALPAELLKNASHSPPPALFSRAARLSFSLGARRRGRPAWSLAVSNAPGPQFPLYLAGARLEALYPISVITDGMGLNISVMSYDGHLDFGLVADREQMPDLRSLAEGLGDALAALQAPPPSTSVQ